MVGRERERVAEQDQGALALRLGRQVRGPADDLALVERQADRPQVDAGQLDRPQADGRRPLDFQGVADDRLARAGQHLAAQPTSRYAFTKGLERVGVVHGDEGDRQVGGLAFHAGLDLVQDAFEGPKRVRFGRQCRGANHRGSSLGLGLRDAF